MGRKRQYQYVLLWAGTGILLATIVANRVFASGLVDYRLMYQSLQQGWQNMTQKDWKCAVRILGIRSLQMAAVALMCRNRLHRILVPLLLIWAGAGAAFSLVTMTWSQGVPGLLIFLVSNFPHQLFYGAAWGILIFKCLSGYEVQKRRFWGAVTALLLFGILAEIHVNAFLLMFIL